MRVLAVLAATCALLACRTRDSDGTATATGSDSGSAVPVVTGMPRTLQLEPGKVTMKAPPIELPKQELFELLDAGKGARQAMRYKLAPGEVEHGVETRIETRQLDPATGKLGGKLALPAIRDGFAIIAPPSPKEPLLVRALAAELDGKPTPVAEQYVAAWRAKLQNRRIDVTLDERGQLGPIVFKDDPDHQRSAAAKDELVQRLLAVTIPLPDKPIAVGARWQVKTVLRQGAAYVKQTADYTLLGRTATRWKLHVKLLRVAEEQTIVDPALPRGASVELLGMFKQLEGDVELDPRRPLIAAGTYTVESRTHAKLKLPGKPTTEQYVEDLGTITFRTK
ncbi:MAG TPA: hypothetical protein VFQ53_12085 [Kofleriaceae bacterium]|nr:hypothetical protein [Kofleriaceae bacterium]